MANSCVDFKHVKMCLMSEFGEGTRTSTTDVIALLLLSYHVDCVMCYPYVDAWAHGSVVPKMSWTSIFFVSVKLLLSSIMCVSGVCFCSLQAIGAASNYRNWLGIEHESLVQNPSLKGQRVCGFQNTMDFV